jgi:hypothetical protein
MTAFYQGGLFGLSGMLPFAFTQSMMAGQGLGGVTIAALNVLTLVFINDPIDAAFIFFAVSVGVLLLCTCLVRCVPHSVIRFTAFHDVDHRVSFAFTVYFFMFRLEFFSCGRVSSFL